MGFPDKVNFTPLTISHPRCRIKALDSTIIVIFGMTVSMLLFISSCTEKAEPPIHPDDWTVSNSSFYKGRVLWGNGWDFQHCQSCHGKDFAGGNVDKSCYSCHEEGVEACYTCHGDYTTKMPYPPNSIFNQADSTLISVGAHKAHMESQIAVVTCNQCHIVPQNYLDSGHLGDDNTAEITFGDLATDGGGLTPVWDRDSATCTSVYCHGAFTFGKVMGNDTTTIWTLPGSVKCGDCHDLPPEGHFGIGSNQCSSCHSSVVDANGNIIDKSKHVNGQKDF